MLISGWMLFGAVKHESRLWVMDGASDERTSTRFLMVRALPLVTRFGAHGGRREIGKYGEIFVRGRLGEDDGKFTAKSRFGGKRGALESQVSWRYCAHLRNGPENVNVPTQKERFRKKKICKLVEKMGVADSCGFKWKLLVIEEMVATEEMVTIEEMWLLMEWPGHLQYQITQIYIPGYAIFLISIF